MNRVLTKAAALKRFLPYGLLVALAALAYLPLAHRLGYYHDDWYLIFAGHTQGAAKFFEVFTSDRPARGPLVALFYLLYGDRPLLYSYSAYALRVLSAFGVYWLLLRIWPRQKVASLCAAALFVVYPGFLSQPEAIDYQTHIFSYTLEIFSMLFTVQALLAARRWSKIGLTLLSATFFLASILFMEYYIGLEGLRLALIWVLVCRQGPSQWQRRLLRTGLHWLPYLLVALAFLYWRAFIFNNTRSETDLTSMVGGLVGSPLLRLPWMVITMLQDTLSVIILAWGVPVYQMPYRMRLRDQLVGGGIAMVAALLLALVVLLIQRGQADEQETPAAWETTWKRDFFWIGLVTVVASLAPVALGERSVVFPTYSRFTLPGSIGSAMVLTSIIFSLDRKWLRLGLLSLLVGTAVLVHYANARSFVTEWEIGRSFWWQVAWRAPQIQAGVTLAIDHPGGGIAEDYVVWGPANLIYYPEKSNDSPTPIRIPATVLNQTTTRYIMVGNKVDEVDRRSLFLRRDYENMLALSMPTTTSCVHLIDQNQPEYSPQDDDRIVLVGAHSRISAVQVNAPPKTPPASVFGPEPAHNWCYYYEKASLARQQGDWKEVVRLGEQAKAARLSPNDWVEWMPFIQGSAYTGDTAAAQELIHMYDGVYFLKRQGCQLFKNSASPDAKKYPAGQQFLVKQFCGQ